MKSVSIPVALTMSYLLGFSNSFANPVVDSLLNEYQQQGAAIVDTESGKNLWYKQNGDRSCSRCHADSPLKSGKHTKTGKPIKAMAVSVNPDRYQDVKKIEKWFRRNCKWTFGRECDAQEKANILAWLNSQ